MEYLLLLALFVFVIGTVIGSFLNVVVLRGLSGESIVLPPSKCPKCGNKLKPWHNVPILSYLFLRGKCAFCKEKISIQYPLVEAFTGLTFLSVFWVFGFSAVTIFALLAACTMIVLAVTDIREKVICVNHAYFLIAVGLIFNTYITLFWKTNLLDVIHIPLVNSILGLIAGVVVMEALARLGYLLVGRRAFGEGDSYIAAGLGAFFGWKPLLIILALAVAVQMVMVLPAFAKRLVQNKDFSTLIPLVGFFIFAGAFWYLNENGFLENIFLLYSSMLAFLILGIYTCRKILAGLKEPKDFTMLPFGPAMVIAAFVVMFMHSLWI